MSTSTSVLVVGDEAFIRVKFGDMLENVGFLLANTPAAAVSILSGHEKIRLILTDMDMLGRMNNSKACLSFLVVWNRDPPKTEYTARAYDS